MPLSWKKKNRCNRFSQLVADHLQSPKHGGSLVVETGFPTSLIDLYVRNRSRFRKSSVMKQTEIETPSPSPSSRSPSAGLLIDSNNSSFGGSDYREIDEIMEEDVVVGGGEMVASGKIEIETENSSKVEVERSDEMAKLNRVMVVVLEVLLMVVLVLRTKRFTFGITVSAFLLFFLESVGKLLLARSNLIRPSVVDSKTLIESSFHETKNINSLKENTTLLEIEELSESKQEVRWEKELDEVRSEVLMEIRHKSSRRAIMKSRMKKLVPKKLRKSSMGSKDEISCGFKEEEIMKCGHDLKPLVLSSECSDSKGETFCILKQEQDKIVEIEEQSSEIDCSDKELGMELQHNSGYLVMCLIVLVGLIGGRVLALVLALSWCVILKKLQWRNVKLPLS